MGVSIMALIKKVKSSVWGMERIPSLDHFPKTMRIVVGAFLGSLAVILQSAGIFTGIGYLLSMMSTGPLVLASLLSLRLGMITYFVTIILLAILQPSELLVFIFTTGLLGLCLGIGINYLKRKILIISFAALCLTLGISIVLYGFKFLILGPSISSKFSSIVFLGLFAFSFIYSWIWKAISISSYKAFHKAISNRIFYPK